MARGEQSKGEQTREAILEAALTLASQVGLEGLTIGRLAGSLDLSKSGLFAHFRSKEALQVQTLDRAAARFEEVVVRPALRAARGEPRLRALFENWLRWPKLVPQPGGCIFVAAAIELDDRPGAARDRLVRLQRDWLDVIAGAVRLSVQEGHFHRQVDPRQFAFELYGIMLVCHHFGRLLRDPGAPDRARDAFEALVARARAPRS
jgi:AcrR family transcriptional regulator